ncbi:hypothetical protein K9O30_03430 [Clostridium bowmanii]|uniref:hypothetical protein n=1 Tax=Clostridium bowmanii TaxID=132925 RepID=UPI001C0DAF3C|nr:hypothetical protein [Clostridium bowmanii]MBU3188412.1 hypothetical protein [Clostridium bowmanii]MCA1072800.1 hypothetical protein [Clostridium bowmanii]
MIWMGIVYVLMGVVYLIYSILRRDKVTYFSREYRRTSEMKVVKSSEFLMLQLKVSIFNSIYLFIYGILIIIFNLNNIFFIAGFLPFHFINLLLIIKSKTKGYVDYKIGENYK